MTAAHPPKQRITVVLVGSSGLTGYNNSNGNGNGNGNGKSKRRTAIMPKGQTIFREPPDSNWHRLN